MHKFEKRDAKSRTLVILAVVGLAAAITIGIFTAVRLIRKPAQSKDDPKTGIVYDDSAIEGAAGDDAADDAAREHAAAKIGAGAAGADEKDGGGDDGAYSEAARGYYSQNAGQRGGRYDGKLPAANGGCGHCVGSVAAVDAGNFAVF